MTYSWQKKNQYLKMLLKLTLKGEEMINEANLVGTIDSDLRDLRFGEKEYYSFNLKTWKKYLDSKGEPKYIYNYHMIRCPKASSGDLVNEHLGSYKEGIFQVKGEIVSYKNKDGLFKTYVDSAFIKHVSSGRPDAFHV